MSWFYKPHGSRVKTDQKIEVFSVGSTCPNKFGGQESLVPKETSKSHYGTCQKHAKGTTPLFVISLLRYQERTQFLDKTAAPE